MDAYSANGEIKMPPKEQIGCRIDPEWRSQIVNICQDLKISPSDWLTGVIGDALGKTDANVVNSIPERVAALEKKLQTLSSLLSR